MFEGYLDDRSAAIVATALTIFVALVAIALVVEVVRTAMRGKALTWKSLPAGAAGLGVVVIIPGLVAASVSTLATHLLVAAAAPFAIWAAITAGAAAFAISAQRGSHNGFDGCVRFLAIGFFGYLTVWGGTGATMSYGTGTGNIPLSEALRIAVFAVPVGIWASTKSRAGQRLIVGLAASAAVGLLLAAIFIPVERGFAQSWLPRNDWLRFPIATAGAACLLGVLIDWRVNRRDKPSLSHRLKFHGFLPACGAMLGLVWAGLYQLSKQF